jgi:hypothetical protein
VKMLGDADSNDVTKVRELRRVFEESASQEMTKMHEMDRNICEISDYIEQMQRFFNKKSSDLQDLRKTISDPSTGRVNSGYSMAKDMIQNLEKKVAEKAKAIIRLKKDVAQRDLQLSMAERNFEETSVQIKELKVEIAEKQRLIEDRDRQIIELREGLERKDRTTENQMLPINEQETNNCVVEKIAIDEQDAVVARDGAIERLNYTISQLQKSLSEKETQISINKQLSNTIKIRQLEPLEKHSPEIGDLLNKLRQETVIIVERLVNANSRQATNSNIPASRSPDKPLRG